ncbi:unnamed protein product [Trichogramma brassicae]|uniref:Uncharacterized protein n=1 Tax=Trichogramma brassicae TaxID=86971 RepID=A0A6H5IVQ8_9HYME|nr:unnamed protein product [Trichogramma brassicae]
MVKLKKKRDVCRPHLIGSIRSDRTDYLGKKFHMKYSNESLKFYLYGNSVWAHEIKLSTRSFSIGYQEIPKNFWSKSMTRSWRGLLVSLDRFISNSRVKILLRTNSAICESHIGEQDRICIRIRYTHLLSNDVFLRDVTEVNGKYFSNCILTRHQKITMSKIMEINTRVQLSLVHDQAKVKRKHST